MTGWRIVFGLAAVFNIAVGAAMLAQLSPLAPPGLTTTTAALLIIMFGVGYAMVARNPLAHRGIALLGLIGKAMMPVASWLHVQAGDAPMQAFYLSLGDLAFAALFLVFLLQTRARPALTPS